MPTYASNYADLLSVGIRKIFEDQYKSLNTDGWKMYQGSVEPETEMDKAVREAVEMLKNGT